MTKHIPMDHDTDTIAAIATPQGEGGISLIRISGGQAGEIARRIFKFSKERKSLESHRIYHGRVISPANGEEIDEALLLYFAQGKSYTGEETVEISCHGGPLVARRVLESALLAGARPAGPGEFSRRAYLNGRIDLSQAEAIADLISASSDRELKNALQQLNGALGEAVKRCADKLTELIAEVESRIDFPEEEDISALPVERIKKEIDAILKEIKELSDSYREGKVLREGYRVVIVGKPNVGKSSLLNRLLGADRAIVTDEAGTTRDIIEERIVLGGLPFILTDTAGLRARYTQEKLAKPEEIGIQRTQAQLEAMRAEPSGGLLLVILDSSQALDEEDKVVLKEAESAPHILIFNKSDLPQKLDPSALPHPFREEKAIKISALKGTGLKELIEALKQKRLSSSEKVKSEGYVVTSARHKSALDECANSLENALAVLENQSLELIALELRLAREALNEIVGKALPDDILDIIFSRFCIGK